MTGVRTCPRQGRIAGLSLISDRPGGEADWRVHALSPRAWRSMRKAAISPSRGLRGKINPWVAFHRAQEETLLTAAIGSKKVDSLRLNSTFGAPREIRTLNPRIRSPSLYPLSYERMQLSTILHRRWNRVREVLFGQATHQLERGITLFEGGSLHSFAVR